MKNQEGKGGEKGKGQRIGGKRAEGAMLSFIH